MVRAGRKISFFELFKSSYLLKLAPPFFLLLVALNVHDYRDHIILIVGNSACVGGMLAGLVFLAFHMLKRPIISIIHQLC